MRKLLKNKLLMGLLLLLLIAALCLLPFPKNIDITQSAILWRSGNPEDVQSTTVTLHGTYWDYLLLEDKFDGSIRVEALPKTYGEMSIVPLGNGQLGLWYADEEMLMKSFGGMFLRADGSVLLLIHEEGHWDAEQGLMLTAPASTREEAVALANAMAKELSPNWLGTYTFK